jgi:hypothetical protein
LQTADAKFMATFLDKDRIKRFYTQNEKVTEENEPAAAAAMFIEDYLKFRETLNTALTECLNGRLVCERDMQSNTAFFTKKVKEMTNMIESLEDQIKQLKRDVIREKALNTKIFVDENVNTLCQKAFFSFMMETQKPTDPETDLQDELTMKF